MIAIIPKVIGDITVYMDVMRAICGETEGKSMIDLCCCTAPNTPLLGFKTRDYVDVVDRKLDHPEEQQHFMRRDVLTIDPLEENLRYDVAICSDGIEHLLYKDGQKLLNIMERLARRRIIFTPSTDLFGMAEIEDNDPEAHRSLWAPETFEKMGWCAILFPDYHHVWTGGAFFAWSTVGERPSEEMRRVTDILINKEPQWLKIP